MDPGTRLIFQIQIEFAVFKTPFWHDGRTNGRMNPSLHTLFIFRIVAAVAASALPSLKKRRLLCNDEHSARLILRRLGKASFVKGGALELAEIPWMGRWVLGIFLVYSML